MLRALVCHYARMTDVGDGRAQLVGQARIIQEAREYIRRHLATTISIEDLTTATRTSPRTLFRAFSEVLGDTPRDYVRRLRLHRIRRELLSSDTMTVSVAAQNWGMAGDLGRLSKNYRNLFGESPSSTLAFTRALQRNVAFVPGAPFYATTPDDATFRMSFTTNPPEEIAEGMRRLASTFSSSPSAAGAH